MHIVSKGFVANGVLLVVGEPVDASKWRNTQALIEGGFIRKPRNDEEKKRIEEASQKDVSLVKWIRQLHEEGLKPKEISLKLAEDGIEMSYQAVVKMLGGG